MKREINEELEEVKTKYKNIIKTIIFLIILLVVFLVIKLIYTYNVVSRVFYSNYKIDFGDNYKITVYKGTEKKIQDITYCKDNIRKIVRNLDETECVIYCTKDKIYSIWPDSKAYECYDNSTKEDINKITLINYYAIGINGPTSKDIWDFIKYGNIRIGKEIDNNKEYITIQDDAYKLWVDKETYLIKKEKLNGQITENLIEKDIVTDEDIKMIDLSEYSEIKDILDVNIK